MPYGAETRLDVLAVPAERPGPALQTPKGIRGPAPLEALFSELPFDAVRSVESNAGQMSERGMKPLDDRWRQGWAEY